MTLVLGIDGGGTGCRAALATLSGDILGRGRGGPANIHTDLIGASRNVADAARQAFVDAGRDPELIASTDAVLGLAGTNVAGTKEGLAAVLPFRSSLIETDALIALEGALGEHDGAIASLGTGTVYLGRRRGELRPIGGWGFDVGDQGSGARLGRELLEQSLLAHDGVRPSSPLARLVLERFNGRPDAVVTFAQGAKPADFGSFAPLVFEHTAAGDPIAKKILGTAVADIEEVLDAFHLAAPERLCLLGGLAQKYQPMLAERHRSLVRPPLQDALGGAVALAIRVFGTPEAVHG